MPGLIGVVGDRSPTELNKLLGDMAQALKHESWYQTHLYTDAGIGLGRVNLGILNPQPQPIWNEDETLCIVMEGEVYGYDDEKQHLIERGHRFLVDNDPEFVLHLYEEYGEDFALKLNGAFVAAIWNPKARELVIVNDRLGLRPLYYAQRGKEVLFGAGARVVAAIPSFKRKINNTALMEYLSFEHLLGDHTLFEGIKLFPPASLMIYRHGHLTLRPYWELQFPDVYEDRNEDDYIEEWTNLIKRAVTRQIKGFNPLAVSLSGGVDSRKILALMKREHTSVLALTFGQPDSDDVQLAWEVAKTLDVEYHFFRLSPDYLLHLAEEGVRLTDGMKSCAHMHCLGPLRQMAKYAQVFYLGYLGGTIHGDSVSPELLAPFDKSTMIDLLFRKRNKLFQVETHQQLLVDSFYRKVNGLVSKSFQAALDRSRSAWAADKNNYLETQEVDRRFTSLGHELLRSQVAVRTPLADKDFLEFTLTVPPGLRQGKSFYFKAFARALPDLAKIPYEGTGLPLVRCFRDLHIRADRQIRWWLRAAGLKWVPERKHRPYADYDAWMRTALRPWVEDTLLNKRALGRGYFNPDYVRNLVAEHMAGTSHARKLGVLLSIELWHRLFLD